VGDYAGIQHINNIQGYKDALPNLHSTRKGKQEVKSFSFKPKQSYDNGTANTGKFRAGIILKFEHGAGKITLSGRKLCTAPPRTESNLTVSKLDGSNPS
jgi:hypothetical protein